LSVYSLILITVILWRPSGLIGVLTDAYGRVVRATAAYAQRVPLDG
jgi:branched-chain amino acid transport system permease protein